MPELLRPIGERELAQVWTDVLEQILRQELARAAPGHCLRVAELPRGILEHLAARLTADQPAGAEVYLVDREAGPEPWRVFVHKVVERRNVEEAAVLALIPPDVLIAAGDSIDISTFRVIAGEGLASAVEAELRGRIGPQLSQRASAVLDYVRGKRGASSRSQRIDFLATIAAQEGNDASTVGGALYAIGLIPDFALFAKPDEFHYRLGQRNLRMVDVLRQETATPLERTLRLPITDEQYRDRLRGLFRHFDPGDVRRWGEAVATSAEWREFALDRWPLDADEVPPDRVRIDLEPLKLPRRPDDGLRILQPANDKLRIAWQTTPPPADVPGLRYFRVEILTSDRVVAWESPLIKNQGLKSAGRSRTLKEDAIGGLDAGIYFARVVALRESGDPFPAQDLRKPDGGEDSKRTNESEDFLIVAGDAASEDFDDVEPVASALVADYTEAEMVARWSAISANGTSGKVIVREREWLTTENARTEAATATIRFDLQRQYKVRLSQRLRRIERHILRQPDLAGHFRCDTPDADLMDAHPDIALPDEFRAARRRLFGAINGIAVKQEDQESAGGVVALADLCGLEAEIGSYAGAYLGWLESRDPRALVIDTVVTRLPDGSLVALVSPTHPIRIVWFMQQQQLGRRWIREAEERREADRSLLATWQRAFFPSGLPSMLVVSAVEAYLDGGPLVGGWGAYVPPRTRDTRRVQAMLRSTYGAVPAHETEADVPPDVLAGRFEAFLRQHPYTPALVLNVINPGDARLVRDALVELEGRRQAQGLPDLRYQVRLFTSGARHPGFAEAFRALADPERQISEVAEQLVTPGPSLLFPKLAWSRHQTAELLESPERFTAHVTLLLDPFPISARVARVAPDDRTSFVHGLVQDVPRRFTGQGAAFAWERRPAPRPCIELPGTPGCSEMLAALLRETGALQAQVLAPNTDTSGSTSVTALMLEPADQSLLYAAHSASTWVMTLDPHLGVDYFDVGRRAERPGYLLDFTPEFLASGARQLMLTTRVDEEIARLMAPAAEELGLEPEGAGALLILEALRSLSGRLALTLQAAPSHARGAVGMALAKLFLNAYGLLESAVIIPLDAHPELSGAQTSGQSGMRGDLLIVAADPEARRLDMLLIEAKNHKGGSIIPADLRERIKQQLMSSERALRDPFDPDAKDPDRIDRSLQSWRLGNVLRFYLDRAVRYQAIPAETARRLRTLFLDLEQGYTLTVGKIGLVFRAEPVSSYLDDEDPEVPIWIVGGDHMRRIVDDALRVFVEAVEPTAEPATLREPPGPSLADDDTWQDVRNAFGRPEQRRLVTLQRATSGETPAPAQPIDETETDPGKREEGSAANHQHMGPGTVGVVVAHDVEEPLPPVRATEIREPTPDYIIDAAPSGPKKTATCPEFAVLLGDTDATPQYGLLGQVSAEPWRKIALDLNGCNTVSVFGVQGAGKSYTVGGILEMAARSLDGLNCLPSPMSAVVFHYHQTQDYPPEFVSMVSPNDDPAQVRLLDEWNGRPARLDDVLVLTTADTVRRRRAEFPGLRVEPIAFASSELTVADWKFLMGATGNDALYLKLLTEAMRKYREDLTLDAVRKGLAEAPLSETQRMLSSARIEFASRFIDDARPLRSLLRPGRLIIVDLRDEFVEKEQALELFVTMLSVFSGAGMGDERFNKLIVFDEAHKYMGGSLIGHVVEVIREMRHKGVSVVVASQDPINVPPAIIELSSLVVLHRFNAPNWLKHIQKSLAALGELTPTMMASLGPGEAFLWANKATDQIFTKRACKVRLRPRATKHGGSTRTAVEG